MRRKKGMNYLKVMPNKSGVPFIMSCIFLVWGFSLVFSLWIPAILSTIGILACIAHRSFEQDHGYYISVEEIHGTETKIRGAN